MDMMPSPIIPVFVVGLGRSGTTLAQSLVGSHPNVLTFPETSFLCYVFGNYSEHELGETRYQSLKRKLRVALGRTSRGASLRMEETLRALNVPLDRNPIRRGYAPARKSVRDWAGVLDKICIERGCSVWLEKTPMHIGYIVTARL